MPRPTTSRRVAGRATVGVLVLLLVGGLTAVTGGSDDITLPGPPASSPLAEPELPAGQPTELPAGQPTEPPASQAGAGTALSQLATIEVKGRAPRSGYEREEFGPRWADTDRNGCDTRNDVLARDLMAETFRPGTRDCVVITGTLAEPYTGQTIGFTKADAGAVQIDHVVSLSNAWQTGAQQWPADTRRAFANDPLNLLAVDGPANAAKSDADAATWLPPNRAFRCQLVARQTAVKARYGLWVVLAEREAIARVLAGCPDEPVPG